MVSPPIVDPHLARRYRRLLWTYPPGIRREELLFTLLECAPPHRSRPTLREVLNLLRHGFRAQLGRPASTAVVVFAILVALAGGFVGAAGASRLSWEFAPALPAGAQSRALADTVFPGLTVWGGGDAELFVPTGDGEDIQYGFADYWVEHTPATRDLRTYAEGVRDRLSTAGWQLRSDIRYDDMPEAVTPVDTVSFWATRPGIVLNFTDAFWGDRASHDSDGAAAFTLSRSEPAAARGAAVGGALLGALLGWLLTGWVSRRTAGRPRASLLVGGLTTAALTLLLPATTNAVQVLVAPQDGPSTTPFWSGLGHPGASPAVVAGILAVAALLVGVLSGSGSTLLPRTRRPSRSVIALVAVVAAILSTTGWYAGARPSWADVAACVPSAPPAEPKPEEVRLSRAARVFIRHDAPPEQRNLAEAAIHRVWGSTGTAFHSDHTSPVYRDAYCAGAPLPPGTGETLPHFWDVWLSSPGVFPALVAELGAMPGVVAVQRMPSRHV